MVCCDISIISSICVLTYSILELIIPLIINVTAEANLEIAITANILYDLFLLVFV